MKATVRAFGAATIIVVAAYMATSGALSEENFMEIALLVLAFYYKLGNNE